MRIKNEVSNKKLLRKKSKSIIKKYSKEDFQSECILQNQRDIIQVDNFLKESNWYFRKLAAELPLTEEQLETVLTDDHWSVRSTAVLMNISRMSESQINRAIADENEFVRGDIFSCGDIINLSVHQLELGIRDINHTVRSMVAEYCNLNRSQIAMLLSDKKWEVRRAVVRRFHISVDQVLQIIKSEKSKKVRNALFEYLQFNSSQISIVKRDVMSMIENIETVDFVGGIINPTVQVYSKKLAIELEEALTHPDFEIRSEALYLNQGKITPRQLKRAIYDKFWSVVSCVVITNKFLLPELLETALTSPHPYVRACALKHHYLSEEQVERGLADENFICRIVAVNYGQLTQSQISVMLCDPHHEVRQQVAMTCQLTDDQRTQFDKDELEYQQDSEKLNARFCDEEMDKFDYVTQLYNISLRGPDEIEVLKQEV